MINGKKCAKHKFQFIYLEGKFNRSFISGLNTSDVGKCVWSNAFQSRSSQTIIDSSSVCRDCCEMIFRFDRENWCVFLLHPLFWSDDNRNEKRKRQMKLICRQMGKKIQSRSEIRLLLIKTIRLDLEGFCSFVGFLSCFQRWYYCSSCWRSLWCWDNGIFIVRLSFILITNERLFERSISSLSISSRRTFLVLL